MMHTNNLWIKSYVIGYYGRSGREDLAEHDLPMKDVPGFQNGLKDGKQEFLDVDLPDIAMAEKADTESASL
jgi:hypothetical protein